MTAAVGLVIFQDDNRQPGARPIVRNLARTAGLEPAYLHTRNVPLIQLSYVRVAPVRGFEPRYSGQQPDALAKMARRKDGDGA